MSQAIENSTDLETRIVGHRGPSTIPGFDLVTVEVVAAEPVEGAVDVLSSRVGERIDLSVPQGLLPAQGVAGDGLRVRASMVGPGVVRAGPVPGAAGPAVRSPLQT